MNEEIKELLDRIKNYPEKLYCLNETEKKYFVRLHNKPTTRPRKSQQHNSKRQTIL